jgi:hypothetical protein
VMDGATAYHVKILHRVIKYVLNTKNRGIRVKPNKENGSISFVGSDYSGDREIWRSITGYLIYLYEFDGPIPTVATSLNEGEKS